MIARPNVLSIAGFDPSSGAGLSADIKTLEKIKCYGLGVCSGNTIQNDQKFSKIYWTPIDQLKEQISVLFESFEITVIKVGVIESWEVLNDLLDYVLNKNPAIKVILDPVLNASASKKESWHTEQVEQNELFEKALSKIFMLTPNYHEISALFPEGSVEENIQRIQKKCHLYLKGGHHPKNKGKDELYLTNEKKYSINPKAKQVFEKHGSGCILSSAISGFLAQDLPVLKACYKAKMYTEKALNSNKSLLAYHY